MALYLIFASAAMASAIAQSQACAPLHSIVSGATSTCAMKEDKPDLSHCRVFCDAAPFENYSCKSIDLLCQDGAWVHRVKKTEKDEPQLVNATKLVCGQSKPDSPQPAPQPAPVPQPAPLAPAQAAKPAQNVPAQAQPDLKVPAAEPVKNADDKAAKANKTVVKTAFAITAAHANAVLLALWALIG